MYDAMGVNDIEAVVIIRNMFRIGNLHLAICFIEKAKPFFYPSLGLFGKIDTIIKRAAVDDLHGVGALAQSYFQRFLTLEIDLVQFLQDMPFGTITKFIIFGIERFTLSLIDKFPSTRIFFPEFFDI